MILLAWSVGTTYGQTNASMFAGTTYSSEFGGSMNHGISLSQPMTPHFSMDLDFFQAKGFNDQSVAIQKASIQTLGAGLRYLPFSSATHAVRPWIGFGVAWQSLAIREDAVASNGQTYHLWDDGLLYGTAQSSPMPDIEFPESIYRDNVFETTLDQQTRVVVPIRAGVEFQLTPRLHSTLSVTSMPGPDQRWTAIQAGIGMHFDKPEARTRTVFPDSFLDLGDDADGDGVKDTKDRCGGTEPGAIVDKYGCALDSDEDGVPDHRDLEPHSPDLLVNEDGVSIPLDEWKAMFVPDHKPTNIYHDPDELTAELSASEVASILNASGKTPILPDAEVATHPKSGAEPMNHRNASEVITYRVQFGAFMADYAPPASIYENEEVMALSGQHGLTLHVGPEFASISEARTALARAQASNHSDAFLTAYQNGSRIPMPTDSSEEHPSSSSDAHRSSTKPQSSITFHVQLGRYSAGVPVDVLNEFLAMGTIEQRMESDGTHRYITSGVNAEDPARAHLLTAIEHGFDDAFLVAEIDGVPASITEARQALLDLNETPAE
jgi:hypothetical protein